VFAIFDKDVDDRISMEHPELYRLGVEDGIFTSRAMISWMGSGVYHSAVIFFFGYYQFAYGGHAFESGLDGDLNQFGVLTFFVLVIVTNFRAGMISLTWTWLMPASLFASISVFLIVAFIIGPCLFHPKIFFFLCSSCLTHSLTLFPIPRIRPFFLCVGAIGLELGVIGSSFYLVLATSMTSARFWLCGTIAVSIALVRDYSWRAHVRLHNPSEVIKRQVGACLSVSCATYLVQ
jgi:magnesium-transporting ATPase (P-type)